MPSFPIARRGVEGYSHLYRRRGYLRRFRREALRRYFGPGGRPFVKH
jgi:hypothetical protein